VIPLWDGGLRGRVGIGLGKESERAKMFVRTPECPDYLPGGADVIRAFVFDLDGTLVETEELSCARAATELCPDLFEGEVVAAFGDLVGLSRREVAVGLNSAGDLAPIHRGA
jgi:hypothetical protein